MAALVPPCTGYHPGMIEDRRIAEPGSHGFVHERLRLVQRSVSEHGPCRRIQSVDVSPLLELRPGDTESFVEMDPAVSQVHRNEAAVHMTKTAVLGGVGVLMGVTVMQVMAD